MQINGVNNNPESQKANNIKEQEEKKYYSIYDIEPQDGTVSVEEQKTAIMSHVGNSFCWEFFIEKCSEMKLNIEYIVNKLMSKFSDIKTDGTEISAIKANLNVLSNINKFYIDICDKVDNLMKESNEENTNNAQ
jgi:DNA repair ATPase RecN